MEFNDKSLHGGSLKLSREGSLLKPVFSQAHLINTPNELLRRYTLSINRPCETMAPAHVAITRDHSQKEFSIYQQKRLSTQRPV